MGQGVFLSLHQICPIWTSFTANDRYFISHKAFAYAANLWLRAEYGPIAATLLNTLSQNACMPPRPTHDAYSMHTVFSPGFLALKPSTPGANNGTMMPDVYLLQENTMICTTSYATKWYITLICKLCTFQTQLRLWMRFSWRDICLYCAGAIVWTYRRTSDSCSCPSFYVHLLFDRSSYIDSANFERPFTPSSFFVPENRIPSFLG